MTLARPESVPEGASPRTYDTDFDVGSVRSRDGLANVYSHTSTSIGPNLPNIAVSTTWASPDNILLEDGIYTSFAPVVNTNSITATDFNFALPSTTTVPGARIILGAYGSSPCTLTLQLILGGVSIGAPKTITLTTSPTIYTLGSLTDSWGTALAPTIVNQLSFGVQIVASSNGFDTATAFVDFASFTLGIMNGSANIQFLTSFTAQDGSIKNFLLDANGNLFLEDLTNNPGILTTILSGITPGSFGWGINGPDVEYLAFNNGVTGSDIPLQWTKNWIDRITQVGPGAAPSFTPIVATTNTFSIATITQPPANSDITDPGHISVLLWSAGPGSTAPGNVLTVYYSPSFFSGAPQPSAEDTLLVNTFNAGTPTYVYISGTPFGTGTYLVTSVGNALPPGVDHFRYYFTVLMTSSNYQSQVEATGQYQMSLATMTMNVPVPGLEVGNQVTISGASVTTWDATWGIVTTPTSAEMTITDTSVTASVATYDYSVVTGTPPTAGQLVTVTGTTNANGQLNVTNAVIQSATGGATGSFTLNVPVVTAVAAPESGQATTAGTVFTIDPGVADAGTGTSPILGNSTGGTLTFTAATAQLIGVGTRQGSVFFITRNGYYTAPAPPVTFTCPANTTAIAATNIPIGPPNVIGRGIILTEPGQNGVPGANFFTIPIPVIYIVENTSYTATSLFVNDNTSTSATFSFTDDVLLNALAVDVYGYDLFNQIEIGNPAWIVNYDSRNFYGGCNNKVQNFVNLSFDGGYLPSLQQGQLLPLGWSSPDIYGQLVVSPKFGDAYYIQNTSGATVNIIGKISQSAYQDAFLQPILQPNTAYSVRITCSNPSGTSAGGDIAVALVSGGVNVARGSVLLLDMSTNTKTFMFSLTPGFAHIPTDLSVAVYGDIFVPGADCLIDRVEIFPTAIPVLGTTVYGSYAGLPEQVDSVTGQVLFISENQQPVNGAMVLYDTFYGLKGWTGLNAGSSLYSLQSSPNLEPAQWQEPEVAQRSGGSVGPMAFDLGEQWFVGVSRAGLYLFVGGQPGKINQEIYQIWDAINWLAGTSIWLKVDTTHRKIYIGVPMATPNFWLPNAPLNTNPTTPNVVLMCNFQGLDSGEMLKTEPQMHTTMFGTLNAIDMRRKWSIWQIPSPYASFMASTTGQQFWFGSGRGNSQVWQLTNGVQSDVGITIDSLYTTAGIMELTKRAQQPALGSFGVRWGMMTGFLETQGTVNVTLYPNTLVGVGKATQFYNSTTILGGLAPGSPAFQDFEAALNFSARRMFVEFRENDGFTFDSLSNLVLHGKKDPWNALRGNKGGVRFIPK